MNMCGWIFSDEDQNQNKMKHQICISPNQYFAPTTQSPQYCSLATPGLPLKVSIKSEDRLREVYKSNIMTKYPPVKSNTMVSTIPSFSNWSEEFPLQSRNLSRTRVNQSEDPHMRFEKGRLNTYGERPEDNRNLEMKEIFGSKPSGWSGVGAKQGSPSMEEYMDLVRENMELKKIIKEEFLPLKNQYARLKSEQEDREYLIAKLEWKVKQLVKTINHQSL